MEIEILVMEETMGLLILQLNWGFKWGPRYGPRIRISRGVRKLARLVLQKNPLNLVNQFSQKCFTFMRVEVS